MGHVLLLRDVSQEFLRSVCDSFGDNSFKRWPWGEWVSNAALDLDIPACRDLLVRYLASRGAVIDWARDRPEALLWALERVETGLPVLGRAGKWRSAVRNTTDEGQVRVNDYGWHLDNGDVLASGPETGDLGMALADRAAMEAGYWLEGGPHPMPEEVTDGR